MDFLDLILFNGIENQFAVACPEHLMELLNQSRMLLATTTTPSPQTTTLTTTTAFSSTSLKPTTTTVSSLSNADSFYEWLGNVSRFYTVLAWPNYISLPMLFIILFLNRRKYIEGHALRMFVFFYIGILFLKCTVASISQIYLYFYQKNWIHFAQCYETYPIKQIYVISNPNKKYYYTRGSSYVKRLDTLIFSLRANLSNVALIFHRIMAYSACTNPLTFKNYYNSKRLRIYYSVIVISIILYTYMTRSYIFGDSWQTIRVRNFIEEIIEIAFILSHLVITLKSIRAIIKYKNSRETAVSEVKYFIWFSLLPIIQAICSKIFIFMNGESPFFGIVELIFNLKSYKNNILSKDIFYIFTVMLTVWSWIEPAYTAISFFICIPVYRRAFASLITCCRKPNFAIVHPIIHGEVSISRS